MSESHDYRHQDTMPGLRDRCLFFLHIPKTAGTSIRELLARHFSPHEMLSVGLGNREGVEHGLRDADRYRLVHGHVTYDAVRLFTVRPFLFTVLRDPVQRAVSAFQYAKRQGSVMQQRALAGEISPERARDYLKARDMTLAEFVRDEPRAAARHLGNLQVEFLTCADLEKRHRYDAQYDIAVTAREVALAKQRLAEFDAFGLTERLPESVEYLACALQIESLGEPGRSNAAPAGHGALEPATLQALQDITRHDRELYAFAGELFEQRQHEMRRAAPARRRLAAATAAAPVRRVLASSFTAGTPPSGEGWYAAENDGRRWFNWTGAAAASWIALGTPPGSAIVLRIWVVHALRQESLGALVLQVNGVSVVPTLSVDPIGHLVTAFVPAQLLRERGEPNRITLLGTPLQRPCDVDPDNHDSRVLGIAVHRIALEASESEAQAEVQPAMSPGGLPDLAPVRAPAGRALAPALKQVWRSAGRHLRALLPATAQKRLHILTRQSPDWRTIPRDELIEGSRALCCLIGRPENFMAEVIALWDETFPVSFFEARAVMKDIAQQNLVQVRDATLGRLQDFDPVDAHARAAAGAGNIYLFIDDDDWLHPHLYQRMRPYLDPAADGYVFGSIRCSDSIKRRELGDYCYTNNYAVSARYLERGEPLPSVSQHWLADVAFHQPGFRLVRVPLHITATNKHPGSTCQLEIDLKDDFSSAALRRVVAAYIRDGSDAGDADTAWISPYLAQARSFYAGLLE